MATATLAETKALVKQMERYHKAKGLTWSVVAAEIGVSSGTIVKWRRGESKPTGKNLEAVQRWAASVGTAKKRQQQPKIQTPTVDKGTLISYVVTVAPSKGASGTVPSSEGLAKILGSANLRVTVAPLQEVLDQVASREAAQDPLEQHLRSLVRDELGRALSNGVQIQLSR